MIATLRKVDKHAEYKRVLITFNASNRAAALLHGFAKEEFDHFFTDVGLTPPLIELPTRDAKHSLNYYEILFNAKYLTEESSREAMYILTQSDFHIGFQARLPKNVRMAHKFGTNQDDHGLFWLHECALVYTEKPYDLCVFTQGRNLYVMRDLLQIISETIYTDQLK